MCRCLSARIKRCITFTKQTNLCMTDVGAWSRAGRFCQLSPCSVCTSTWCDVSMILKAWYLFFFFFTETASHSTYRWDMIMNSVSGQPLIPSNRIDYIHNSYEISTAPKVSLIPRLANKISCMFIYYSICMCDQISDLLSFLPFLIRISVGKCAGLALY